jgi:DNA-binding response OmpR family regulator
MEIASPTVLIVEDFADTRHFLEHWLNKRNFRVVQACDGWEAVDVAMRERPALILMDINIPVLDGIEVACLLREGQSTQVPIIAITAHDSADYRAEAEEVGFDEYLTKPIDFDRLESAIHRLLQRDAA